MWSKSLTTELQQEELTQSDKMLQWEFGAEKEKCMSLDMKLTGRPSLVHKGLDFLLQDLMYFPWIFKVSLDSRSSIHLRKDMLRRRVSSQACTLLPISFRPPLARKMNCTKC